jgi:plasmid stabilization system protein ParE
MTAAKLSERTEKKERNRGRAAPAARRRAANDLRQSTEKTAAFALAGRGIGEKRPKIAIFAKKPIFSAIF